MVLVVAEEIGWLDAVPGDVAEGEGGAVEGGEAEGFVALGGGGVEIDGLDMIEHGEAVFFADGVGAGGADVADGFADFLFNPEAVGVSGIAGPDEAAVVGADFFITGMFGVVAFIGPVFEGEEVLAFGTGDEEVGLGPGFVAGPEGVGDDVWGRAFVAEGVGAEGFGALVCEVHGVGFGGVFVAVVLEFAALVLEDVALGGGGEVGGGVGAGESDGSAEHVHFHVGEVVGVGGFSLGEDGVEIDEGLELFS